jgi:PIN domain nuclease of toxin-antitoxin system
MPHLEATICEGIASWPVKPQIVVGENEKRAAFRIARAALAKSGTVTLELALSGIPMVTAYRVGAIEAFILRRAIRVSSVILANLVIGKDVIPEFLQEDCTPEKLAPVLNILEDAETTLLLSAISSWEIAVKWELGKLELPEPPERFVPDRMQRNGIEGLAVLHTHALGVANLPRHHRDPFDRMLIAQALAEDIPLLTGDDAIRAYDVEVMWVG